MPRKLPAILSALALALCFSRAAAWASVVNHGDAHACCRHGAPAKTPTLNDCCVSTAAVGAVHLVRVDAPALLVALPVLPAASALVVTTPDIEAPPGARTYRAAVPARAPPLA
jgi:hypothetical protein